MSKESLERFMTRVADSEDLQAKIGEEITGEALVALGAAHGYEFSIEDVQASAELSGEELEGVSGGVSTLPLNMLRLRWVDYNDRLGDSVRFARVTKSNIKLPTN